jgi:hypothetical protein
MSILTPYLDGVILASSIYPSGFGYSLFSAWRGERRQISTGLLAFLALPFFLVTLAVLGAKPELLTWRAPSSAMLAIALLAAPVALGLEYFIHACAAYLRTGTFPRRIAMQSFWSGRLSALDHFLLVLIAGGEEIFYRAIWIGVLTTMGAPAWAAVAMGGAAYGMNHLAFGWLAVGSKTASGILYGAIYVIGGGSVVLPIAAHVAQNACLFWRAGAARG